MNQYRKFQLQINGVLSYATDDAQRLHTAEIQVGNTLTITKQKYIKQSTLTYDEQNRPIITHNYIIEGNIA